MEVLEISQIKKKNQPTAIALGFFDGLHLGHRNLIEKMKKISLKDNLESCVLTFREHPLNLIFHKYAPKLISSNEEKIKIFKNLDIDNLIFIDFTEEIMNLSPEEFVKKILMDKLNAKYIIIGYNYNFGHKGKGTPELLNSLGEKYGFKVIVMEPFEINKQIVSSTYIRNLINSGSVHEVEKYLGRKYSITGNVIKGKGLGRKYSIPTANIEIDNKIILPNTGVYFANIVYNNSMYYGLTNIGYNPTFNNHPFSIETYIFDFNEDIYNRSIRITFIDKIRDEIKFNSVDELMNQIRNDMELIKQNYISK